MKKNYSFKNKTLNKIVRIEVGHSLAARRLFFYIDEPRLAHHIRHNSVDFVYDIASCGVTVPQLILNLLDKTDDNGEHVSIDSRYDIIKNKIGEKINFNDRCEQISCSYLKRIEKEKINFNDYEFITNEIIPSISCLFIQRWDNKYCAPIGKYSDTNSNLHISRITSKWGYKTTILHGGDFQHKESDELTIIGTSPNILNTTLDIFCAKKELIIVEGSTTRISKLRSVVGSSTSLVLLLRTMIDGNMEVNRLKNALAADEIWVQTNEMKNILEQGIKKHNLEMINIRLLQSGVEENIFKINEDVARIKHKICYLGALSTLKGVDVLIEAFKMIRKKYPDATLHLVGDVNIYGSDNTFISESKLKKIPGVILHGVLRATQIAPILQSAHVSCLLTTIFETFGKSAMQARMCGTRMIVSNKGNNPFHVQTHDEGEIVENINKDSVYKALMRVLSEDPKTVKPPVERYHTWKVTALDFVTNYNLLIRNNLLNNINANL